MMQPTHDPLSGPALPYGLPDDWPKPTANRSPFLMFSAVFVALLTLGTLTCAVWAAYLGYTAAVVGFSFGAIYLGHLVGGFVSRVRYPRRRGRPPTLGVDDQGERGLTYTFARMPYYWLFSVLVMTSMVLGFAAVATATQGSPGEWITAALASAGAVFVTWLVIRFLRRAPGRVVLTPSGVYYRSISAEYFTPWDSIFEVGVLTGQPMIAVKAYPSPQARRHRFTRRGNMFEEQFLPFLVLDAYWLGANARPVYQAIDHYLRNRERRPLLSSPEAITAATGIDRW